MDIMEIVLLAAGGVVFVLSFLIPMKKEESSEETRGLAKEEIKALVSEELEAVRGHVDDVVEEAVTYSIEKTERSLERLSNEKIMAVNEYSDTVLAEIHKNHEEVMFLYDMLNDKHMNLKNTVSEVNRTVKEVKETKKEAEEVVNTFQRLAPETVIPLNTPVSAMASQAYATAQQEPASSVVPSVFAAAPAPAEMPSSEGQPVSSPLPSESPVQPPVSPTLSLESPVQPPVSPTLSPVPSVPQPVSGQTPSVPQRAAAESRQIRPVPSQTTSMSQKVSPASRKVSPPPQKVAFSASKRNAAVPQTVTVSTQEFTVSPIMEPQSLPEPVPEPGAPQASGVINFARETDGQGRNYNDRVLELYKSGKSNVAIARELNLGVGEVKLVIDLYKNRSEK